MFSMKLCRLQLCLWLQDWVFFNETSGHFSGLFVATETGILSRNIMFSKPQRSVFFLFCFFAPKPNQSIHSEKKLNLQSREVAT